MGKEELYKKKEVYKEQKQQMTRFEEQQLFQRTFEEQVADYEWEGKQVAMSENYSSDEKEQLATAGALHKRSAKKKIQQERKTQRDLRMLNKWDIADTPLFQTKALEDAMIVLQSQKKYAGKTEIMDRLHEAYGFVGDVERLLTQKFGVSVLEQENYMEAQINTLMILMEQSERLLRDVAGTIRDSGLDSQIRDVAEKRIRTLSAQYGAYKKRAPHIIRQKRVEALRAERDLTMDEVLEEARTELVFGEEHIKGNAEGGQISEVIKLNKGEKKYYFKEETHSLNTYEALKDYLEKNLSGVGKDALLRYLEYGLNEKFLNDPANLTYEEIALLDSSLGDKLCAIRFFLIDLSTYEEAQKNAAEVSKEEISKLADDIAKKRDKMKNSGGSDLLRMITSDKKWWQDFSDKLYHDWRKANTRIDFERYALGLVHGENMMDRNLAAERMAELMGVQKQLVHSTEAFLETIEKHTEINQLGEREEKERVVRKKGFIMDEALGKDSVHIQMKVIEENLTIHYTPEAMRQMMNLSVLDQLTSQADRHGNNVFFQYEVDDEKKILWITGASGIDNDEAFAKAVMPEQINDLKTHLLYQEKNGKNQNWVYGLDVMDQKMYETLMSLTPELIEVGMKDYLDRTSLEMLKKRTKLFQDAVNAKMNVIGKDKFLIREWNEAQKQDIKDSKVKTLWHWLEGDSVVNDARVLIEEANMKKAQEVAKAG